MGKQKIVAHKTKQTSKALMQC